MKILFVVPPLQLSGSIASLYHLLFFLKSRAHQVALLTPGGPLFAEFAALEIPLWQVPFQNHWFLDMFHVNRFRGPLSGWGPDVLHVYHHSCADFGGEIARVTGKPYILTVPHSLEEGQTISLSSRLPEAILTMSQAGREHLVNDSGAPKSLISVIPHGINLEAFSPIPAPLGEGKVPTLGGLGRLEAVRGYKFLIEAGRKLADQGIHFQLFLAGEGQEESRLRHLVQELDLQEEVTFLPLRTLHYADYLRLLDVMVVPSLLEGQGQFLLEAMACGKPVVAFASGGLCDCVRDGKTGYLVPKRDVATLASRLLSLLQDAGTRRTFGEAGRRFVEEHYSLEQYGNRLLETYRKSL